MYAGVVKFEKQKKKCIIRKFDEERWNARAVRAKCAELSTFEKINTIVYLSLRNEFNLESRSEKKGSSVSWPLKEHIYGLRSPFPFRNKNFNWFLSQFVVIYFWSQVVNYDFFGVNLNKFVQRKRLKIVVNYEIKQNIYSPDEIICA